MTTTKKLLRTLNQTNSLQDFVEKVACELDQYGILDWAYTQIDLPKRLTTREYLGTLDQKHIDTYVANAFYDSDLMLHHVQMSNTPRFQSDIEHELNATRFEFIHKGASINFITMNKDFGYKDVCCIPTLSPIDGSRFLLTVTSKDINETTFKKTVSEKLLELRLLSAAICECGTLRHKDVFFAQVKSYRALAKSAPVKLLKTMNKHDLNISQAARFLGISRNTAKQQLETLRAQLNVKTNHAASIVALQQGLFD